LRNNVAINTKMRVNNRALAGIIGLLLAAAAARPM
jgi:hypothetical protein